MTTQAPIARFTRLRHATFASPDSERLLDYYRGVIGLGLIGRDGDRIFLASDSDQLSLVIEPGEAALTSIAFEISPDVEMAALEVTLKRADLRPELRSDPLPGISRLLSFIDPEGTRFELIQGWTPTPAQERIGALAVIKLGHVALRTPDPLATSNFCADVMGLRVSDWVEDRFVFMRSGYEHHTLNFARAPVRSLHHLAFELRGPSHMQQACDHLARHKLDILWGPVRHGPGHNTAVYHRNPDGHLVELFHDLDRMIDEELGYFDPRPWHRDRPQRPKVWVGLPRDVWGLPPSPECVEFAR
ncbi:glyoxalase [Bradyrhizobium sp. WBOS7]|uniref:Glyoxalase n=3 Tax=Nitrobacteraceae TaxID=41294 RepID=A0AAE9NHH7_9BRAD|nr:glyoxalase [Bradyrhizobium sp. WBOS2]MDD1573433.1 glyoxalase [Bradyrhizobium sp. WBOS1]MDD1579568.1 glyoxalase [Bradyrhizobium sp. WBOS7]MDD1603031.1 glyoxalase [Bradyrhizobium sp. WBOS16]UUO38421.1 glyoxalase [Bradyrhizobium sp. WBOS01]UUO44589.1 glyoxalase [Bradyrhizobium sp. WBOS02]UUO54996.1 glyoxalase [Bradyrhizobium sp. WBOS07]UUO69054.1 glyoxalase [Bradyrhizobium betae]